MAKPPVDKFGKLVIEQLHDRGIGFIDRALVSDWKAPGLADLQGKLRKLNDEQKALVRQCVIESVRHGMHDLLFGLQEANDLDEGIQVLVDRENVAGLSDGLHGEAYGSDGWIAKFSKYPETERA